VTQPTIGCATLALLLMLLFVAQQIEKHSGIDLFGMPLLSGQSIYEVNAE